MSMQRTIPSLARTILPARPAIPALSAQSALASVLALALAWALLLAPGDAQAVIDVSQSFGIDARIVGHIHESEHNRLSIITEHGRYEY